MASVKSLIESQNRMRKIISSPAMEAINSNRRLIESINYPKEILKSNAELFKRISLKQELMPVSQQLKIMSVSKYINHNSFQHLKQINEMYNSFRFQYENISNLQGVLGVKQYIEHINYRQLILATATIQDALSSLNINYNNICIDDIEVESVEDFIHDMTDDTEILNWEQRLVIWIDKVKIKHPVLLWVLLGIISTVICTQISQPINDLIDSIPSFLESKSNDDLKLDIDKNIKGYMKENVYNDFYEFKEYIFNTYRFINSDDVYLRKTPKMNSYTIEKFKKGDVIKIIRKNNHWSYVEYENKDGEILNGWINTRYTKRFD